MLAATMLVVFAPARIALAQNLPDAVITSSPVTPEGKAEIAKFIESHKAGLSGEAAAIRKSKNNLAAPLTNPAMSESFRREYGGQLLLVITPLASSDKEQVAINALRLAGLSGTKDGLELALKGLDDKRTSVRFEGAMGVGLAISTGRSERNRAISASTASDALTVLNTKLLAEQDPRVTDAMMLALDDAMKVGEADLPGVRTKAMALVLANTQRLAGIPGVPALDQALSHGVKTIGEALIATGADKLPPATVTNAACVAGDVVAAVQRRLEATPSDAERSLLGLIAQQCERIVQQAAGTSTKYNFDESIHENKDAEFVAAAQRLYRDLSGPPFGCKPDNRYPKP